MKFLLFPLIGKNSKKNWIGYFESNEKGFYAKTIGRLFILVNITAPESFDSAMAGKMLLDKVNEVFFDEAENLSYNKALEKAILSSAKLLEVLLEREKVASVEGIDLNIEAIVFYRNFVYFAKLGSGGIFIIRGQNLINLEDGLKDLSGKNLVKTGSGKFTYQDIFILMSPSALLDVREEQIRVFIKEFNFSVFESIKDREQLGVLFIKVDKDRNLQVGSNEGIEQKKLSYMRQENEKKDLDKGFDKDFTSRKNNLDYESIETNKYNNGEQKTFDAKEKEVEAKNKKDQIFYSIKKKVAGVAILLGKVFDHVKQRVFAFSDSKIGSNLKDKKTYKVIFDNFLVFLKKAVNFFKKFVWDELLGFSSSRMYIKGKGPRSKVRGIIILIIVLLLILYLSVRSIQRRRVVVISSDKIEEQIPQIDNEVKRGEDLGKIGDISGSVNILEGVISKIDQILLENPNAKKESIEKLEAKKKQIIAIENELKRAIEIDDSKKITDIGGYIEGAEASDMVLIDAKLFISDKKLGQIYIVSENGGAVSVFVGNGKIKGINSLTVDDDKNIIAFDSEAGLVKINSQNASVEKMTGLSRSSVGEINSLDFFIDTAGNKFIYGLRSSKKDIIKITKFSSGYSLPQIRLSSPKLATGQDLAIDGKIYISNLSNSILRYYSTDFDQYTLINQDKEIQSKALGLDNNMVFVGDDARSRIVVFSKDSKQSQFEGKYICQFTSPNSLTDIKEIVIDKSSRILYILDGNKVFKTSLAKVDEYYAQFR